MALRIISKLRMPEEFTKAIALEANTDAAATSNSAMHGVGCMRHTYIIPTIVPSTPPSTNNPKNIFRKVSIRRHKTLKHRLPFQRDPKL
tara:strand:- start:191 stop:457 length:267 start_codon:yes stop_codon:yes gene_type:complete